MPAAVQRARWETSQRPLFIKTVWRNGLRHAILSRDDPLFTKPEQRRDSSSNTSVIARFVPPPIHSNPTPSRPSELERCLMKLQLVLAAEPRSNVVLLPQELRETRSENRQQQQQQQTVESCEQIDESSSSSSNTISSESESEGEADEVRNDNVEQNDECDTCDESINIPSDPNWLPELNPLSERVLQWLELEAKKSRPRYFDLRTLRRRDTNTTNNIPKTPAQPPGPVPRISSVRRVRRRVVARWSPQHKSANNNNSENSLTITAQSVPRKPLVKVHPPLASSSQNTPPSSAPRVTWSGEPTRPQLHIFIPNTEYELSDCCSESRSQS